MLRRAGWFACFSCAACAASAPAPLVGSAQASSPDAGLGTTPPQLALSSSATDSGVSAEAGSVIASTDAGMAADEVVVADEAPYAPGSRRRPGGAVAASNDDDVMARWNRGGPGAGTSAKAPHPAPRVKVDVVQVRGRIPEDDVLRAARAKGYWPFRLCYEDGLRRTPKLHGTVKLKLTVGPEGSARGVKKAGAEIDDALVVSCVLKAARNLTLPQPERGTPEVTLEVSLWPGDALVRSGGSLPEPRAPSDAPDALVAALRSRWPQVRACYVDGLRRNPDLWGRLAMRFRITRAGQIVEATEVESHFPDRDVSECILEAYERAGLAPYGDDRVIVYPLRLGTPP